MIKNFCHVCHNGQGTFVVPKKTVSLLPLPRVFGMQWSSKASTKCCLS